MTRRQRTQDGAGIRASKGSHLAQNSTQSVDKVRQILKQVKYFSVFLCFRAILENLSVSK